MISTLHMIGRSSVTAAMEGLLRKNYSPVYRDDKENVIRSIEFLLSQINDRKEKTQSILAETVKAIHRSFGFQDISIALRDSDRIFRYKIVTGLSSESTKVLLTKAYSESEVLDESRFPYTSVSDITKFFMSENEPYNPDDTMTYFRPKLLSQTRGRPDDMLPGDYIDFFFKNRSNEAIGFIEVGETRSGKLPDRSMIMWLELIATLLGAILCDRLEG